MCSLVMFQNIFLLNSQNDSLTHAVKIIIVVLKEEKNESNWIQRMFHLYNIYDIHQKCAMSLQMDIFFLLSWNKSGRWLE